MVSPVIQIQNDRLSRFACHFSRKERGRTACFNAQVRAGKLEHTRLIDRAGDDVIDRFVPVDK